MNNIVYLDADFVIKTSQLTIDSSTLFDRILELPYTFKITNKVLAEIKRGLQTKLVGLIAAGKISVIRTSDCINDLAKFYNIATVENIVLSSLKEISEDVTESEDLYKTYFSKLEVHIAIADDLSLFSNELDHAIASVPNGKSIGEIVTLLNMSLTNRLQNTKVISLLSHDSAARKSVLSLHENINSYDCHTCLHLLKENCILDYAGAKKYASAWLRTFPKNTLVKIIENKRAKGVDPHEFVRIMFCGSKYSILRNGILKKE